MGAACRHLGFPLTTFLVQGQHQPGIMSSGIEVKEECITAFNDMKLDKSKRCIIYKISEDKKSIVIDKAIDKEDDQEQQYSSIVTTYCPAKEGRYIVWDLKIPNPKSGAVNDKLVFMSWSPDNAPVQARMIFASSKDAIKKKLTGIGTVVDCSDYDETNYSEVCNKVGH